ncbi:hypothetical protein [Polaribacter sp.]|uniref:hypothetical protein n=1 Tax=Polaribacter sp. TaxID=1920175 RepID=UPI003F6B5B32
MTHKLFLFLILIPICFFAQTAENSSMKTISGFIKYNNKPLENATIFVEKTTNYSVSNEKGFYSIKAKVGDFLSFSYVDLNTVEILVEDVTTILNIEMNLKNTIADSQYNKVKKLGETNIGEHIKLPLAIKIDGSTLNKNSISLTKAIQEKAPYLLIRYNGYGEEISYIRGKEMNGPVIWTIDDVSFDIPFDVFIHEVKTVFIVNHLYKNPEIKVYTNIDYTKIKGINFDNYYFTEDDFYNNDAIAYKKTEIKYPFLEKYKKLKIDEAIDLFSKTKAIDKNTTNFHFALFNYFKKEKNSTSFLLQILADYERNFSKNPEDLKALAYKYEEINELEKALDIYKKIIKLRPNHLQSYRDLANIFLELKQYRDVWLTYKVYFKNGFKIDESDIGEIITSEIIATYNLDTIERTKLQKIKVKDPTKNVESDVRVVFEWNTTEAEFIIEIVNPNLEVFELENSLIQNIGLIEDQKQKGYTSKEIFIDHLNYGNYLVNLTYLGNKQYKPTSFKITTYYNWGRQNQTKKIDIFDFGLKDKKVQLLKLNRRFLR